MYIHVLDIWLYTHPRHMGEASLSLFFSFWMLLRIKMRFYTSSLALLCIVRLAVWVLLTTRCKWGEGNAKIAPLIVCVVHLVPVHQSLRPPGIPPRLAHWDRAPPLGRKRGHLSWTWAFLNPSNSGFPLSAFWCLIANVWMWTGGYAHSQLMIGEYGSALINFSIHNHFLKLQCHSSFFWVMKYTTHSPGSYLCKYQHIQDFSQPFRDK
jgi:hypothetical protein